MFDGGSVLGWSPFIYLMCYWRNLSKLWLFSIWQQAEQRKTNRFVLVGGCVCRRIEPNTFPSCQPEVLFFFLCSVLNNCFLNLCFFSIFSVFYLDTISAEKYNCFQEHSLQRKQIKPTDTDTLRHHSSAMRQLKLSHCILSVKDFVV